MCLLKYACWLYDRSHISHQNGLIGLWIFRWTAKLDACVKHFSHLEHWCGFSPVWIRVWVLSEPGCVNRFPQIEHWNGLSPVCVLRCCTRSLPVSSCMRQIEHWYRLSEWTWRWSATICSVLNFLSHFGQPKSCSFASSWHFMCSWRLTVFMKPFSHTWQVMGFFVWCDRRWTTRLLDCVNFFSHLSHLYGFSPRWILRWVFKLPMWVKDLPQIYGEGGEL